MGAHPILNNPLPCGISELAQDVKISVGSVDKITHNHLHMQKLFARWVPRLLTPLQKQKHINCSKALFAMFQGNLEDFLTDQLCRMKLGSIHDLETKGQSKQWKQCHSPPKK
ncbi:uncharacterized protein LOC119575536 [Penaeus monodon]|uniref:uncharacterized protein LOC119575536 n=1 Tax=Penaeus monodon TaxID=6687 RepID=UPI0018A7D2F6|nr:uncharacterized protein LOC119575536 [Penaeus monodon]